MHCEYRTQTKRLWTAGGFHTRMPCWFSSPDAEKFAPLPGLNSPSPNTDLQTPLPRFRHRCLASQNRHRCLASPSPNTDSSLSPPPHEDVQPLRRFTSYEIKKTPDRFGDWFTYFWKGESVTLLFFGVPFAFVVWSKIVHCRYFLVWLKLS